VSINAYTTSVSEDVLLRSTFHSSHVASVICNGLGALHNSFYSIIGGESAESPPIFQSEDELVAWLQSGAPALDAFSGCDFDYVIRWRTARSHAQTVTPSEINEKHHAFISTKPSEFGRSIST